MVLSDPDGIVLAANPAYFALYGYPPEVVLGHSFAIIFPAERREWAVAVYRTAFTSPGVPAPYEATIRRADGTERTVESRIDFLTTAGTRTAMLSTIRDITDRTRMEQALRASEAEYRAIFELAGAAAAEADVRTGQFRRVNRKLSAFTGYGAEELLTMTIQELTHPDDRGHDQAAFDEMTRGVREEYATEKRYIRKDGAVVWGQVSATMLRGATGEPQHVVAVIQDITARKCLENERAVLLAREQTARLEAQEAVRVRDAFLSIAAHELKTPLTTLLGTTDQAQRRAARHGSATERDQRALGIIAEQARRLAQLLDDLLDVSRLESGQLTIERVPLDLGALARRVVEQLQATWAEHTVTLHTPAVPALVAGDGGRLEQVLQNLLENAIKYSPAGGPIVVQLARGATEIQLTVTDTGIGIPAEALPNLFRRFYRAGNAQAQHIRGSGIGLYVVSEIVNLHGGRVEVQSVEGQGTTVTIRLPLAGTTDGT